MLSHFITSPFLLSCYTNLKKYFVRQKLYATYEEALSKCKTKQAYQQDDLVKVILKKTKIFKTKLENDKYLFSTSANSNIMMCLSFILKNRCLNVIDVGGACGAHYFTVKKFYDSKINLNWNVVETNKMYTYAKQLENDELKFHDNLKRAVKICGPVDLLFSSSTIPYFSNPRLYLKDITSLNAEYILLTRLSFTTEDKDIITIQKSRLKDNGIGPLPAGFRDRNIYYPHTNMNEKDFTEIIGEKYSIKIKFEENSGIRYVNNRSITGYGMLLQRKLVVPDKTKHD